MFYMKLACRTVCALAVPALLLSLSPASAAPSVKVGGTVLRITFDDGQIVSGRALSGRR